MDCGGSRVSCVLSRICSQHACLYRNSAPQILLVALSATACVLKLADDLPADPMKDFREMKQRGEKITALTAYDYPTARLLDESGIDIILVGDSLGMVVLGCQDTTCVTLEQMLHHTRAVARGVKHALLVADLPIHTYDTPKQAVETARKFIDVGAQPVKLQDGV